MQYFSFVSAQMPKQCYISVLAAERWLFGGEMFFFFSSFMLLYEKRDSVCKPEAHVLALVPLQ